MLYSILITYRKDDFVIQSKAGSAHEAIHCGIENHKTKGIRLFTKSEFKELESAVKEECDSNSCVAVNDLANVWCDTFLVNNHLVQMHVVSTVENT